MRPLPPGLRAPKVYMFYFGKRGGGIPQQPVPFEAPNDLGLAPGEQATLWYFDESPRKGEAPNDWRAAGTGTVSADGRTITTDPGVGIPKFCCGSAVFAGANTTANLTPGPTTQAGLPTLGADPVDLSTGIFLLSATDLVIPGRTPLAITRSYRSGDTNVGVFGLGTMMGYEEFLQFTSATVLTYVYHGDARTTFVQQADGTYTNGTVPAFRGARITLNSNGTLTLLVVGFGLYSGALVLNASLAFDREEVHSTSVISIVGGEPDSWVGAAYTWADLRPWRTRGGIERVILYPHERSALWVGRPVIVSTKPGRFGMPWVVRIEPDEEEQQRAILDFAPSASRPRKQLVRIYSRRGDYDRAIGMAKEYLAEYPNDRDFATRFADELFNASRWASAVPLLEPFLRGKPDPTLYGLLGFAMTRGGRKAEGVALLEMAAALDPANWWTFYALGYAHFYDGEFSEAAAPFERVLKLRPDFPEIEERLRTIRSKKPA